MSHLINEDTQCVNDQENGYWTSFPSYKFLCGLHDSKLLWTPNLQDYFLLGEEWIDVTLEKQSICLAYLRLNIVENTMVKCDEWRKHAVHIQCLCTQDDYRGTGAFPLLMSILLSQAEESGVFVYGHSRPFYISLPRITNHNDAERWIESAEGKHEASLKRDKIQSRELLKKYRECGFCRFDGAGVRCGNRFWKKMHFGFRSSKMESSEIGRFLDNHLHCN